MMNHDPKNPEPINELMRMQQLNACDALTADEALALCDWELAHYWRRLTRAHLAHLREMLEPTSTPYPDDVPEPHGMWSDDGSDYLTAALDLAQELRDCEDPSEMRAKIADWASYSDQQRDYEDGADFPMPNLIYNHACDGISNMLYALLPDTD